MALLAQTTKTITANSNQDFNIDVPVGGRTVRVLFEVTAVAGTSPTLDYAVTWSSEAKDEFAALAGEPSITQLTATGAAVYEFVVAGEIMRLAATIGGTAGPSFTVRTTIVG